MNWFLLFLPEPGTGTPDRALDWVRVGGSGSVAERGSAALPEAASRIRGGDRVLAVVPGERVLLHHVAIPARSRTAQLQALPFALEDRLSEDIEALHIVPGPRRADGQLLAAVAAHRDMESWRSWLLDHRIPAQHLLPDTLLLPDPPETGLRIHWQGERCLLSEAGSEPLALASELLPWWLERWLGEKGHAPVIEWMGPRERIPATIQDHEALQVHGWDGNLPTLLAPALRRRPPLNLLVGRYAPEGAESGSFRRWRVAAIVAAVLAGVWTASLWVEVRVLEREARALDQAIAELFEATLPGTRMVDPRGQFRQVLEAGGAAPSGAGPLSSRLGLAAPVLVQSGGTLRQLRADGDRLEIEIDLDSIGTLDALRSRLAAQAGGQVRILAAESGDEGVRARLQIEGGGS